MAYVALVNELMTSPLLVYGTKWLRVHQDTPLFMAVIHTLSGWLLVKDLRRFVIARVLN